MNGIPFVIGIAGPAGVGKSTLAQAIQEAWPHVRRYSFAQPLKAACFELFTPLDSYNRFYCEKETVLPQWGITPRQILQWVGTECFRELFHKLAHLPRSFWIMVAEQQIYGGTIVVIDDVRFIDESDWVRQHGMLIHLRRRGVQHSKTHPSEFPVTPRLPDMLFIDQPVSVMAEIAISEARLRIKETSHAQDARGENQQPRPADAGPGAAAGTAAV